ncbi:hypothetical protein KN1_14060 [Stygiolobus caldivivus]|uniref:Uncharacterized protein n=1 Tax=Stygiolobus caldivivus TaxID=2824673 RepID=A0A8D5ZHY0_9CREN|nr:hypothetical protein KN1_14060 [Stygiolobus caldivivus]
MCYEKYEKSMIKQRSTVRKRVVVTAPSSK